MSTRMHTITHKYTLTAVCSGERSSSHTRTYAYIYAHTFHICILKHVPQCAQVNVAAHAALVWPAQATALTGSPPAYVNDGI